MLSSILHNCTLKNTPPHRQTFKGVVSAGGWGVTRAHEACKWRRLQIEFLQYQALLERKLQSTKDNQDTLSLAPFSSPASS